MYTTRAYFFNAINATDIDGKAEAEPSTSNFNDALMSNPSGDKKKDTGIGMSYLKNLQFRCCQSQ